MILGDNSMIEKFGNRRYASTKSFGRIPHFLRARAVHFGSGHYVYPDVLPDSISFISRVVVGLRIFFERISHFVNAFSLRSSQMENRTLFSTVFLWTEGRDLPRILLYSSHCTGSNVPAIDGTQFLLRIVEGPWSGELKALQQLKWQMFLRCVSRSCQLDSEILLIETLPFFTHRLRHQQQQQQQHSNDTATTQQQHSNNTATTHSNSTATTQHNNNNTPEPLWLKFFSCRRKT